MTATYHLNEAELDDRFLKAVRAQFKGKDIEVTVQEVEDETAFLMANEANRDRLLAAIANIEAGRNLVEVPLKALK